MQEGVVAVRAHVCPAATKRNGHAEVNHDFFAVLWNVEQRSSCDTVVHITATIAQRCPHLVLTCRLNGFEFYVSNRSNPPYPINPIPDRGGMVFGTLFTRPRDSFDSAGSSQADFNCNSNIGARILVSGGRHLVDNYWGHYIAFLVDETNRLQWIFRSPACHQPCLNASHGGARLYFSTIEDLAQLRLVDLTINWDFVAAFAASTRVSSGETGLNEIGELGTGEFHRISNDGLSRGFHWNAAKIARQPAVEDSSEAKRSLRSTVRACVSTWASVHPRIVQRLSGGLDSSITAVCLKLAPSQPSVTYVNYYSRGTYGDERQYARAVAEKTKFPLVEYRHNSSIPMDVLLALPRAESPVAYMSRGVCDQREIDLADRLGATARFTGIMGDSLFQMPPAVPTASEYLRTHGLDRRFLQIALNSAQMDRVSLWTVLRGALIGGLLKPPKQFQPGEFSRQNDSLLTTEASQAAFSDRPLRFVHPWLQDLEGVPLGKFAQIASLSFNSVYFNVLHDPLESELVHPLASEPLMELCLRLPSYVLLYDGWDRALARDAFDLELPHIVRTRTTKGSSDLHLREMIAHNEKFIRDLLVEGVLVRQGILDRKKLSDSLPGQTTRSALPLGLLWATISAEAWSRAWIERAVPC